MMDGFIRSQIHAAERRPGSSPDPAQCLEVSKQASVCVAAAAGVARGDWLVSVDGVSAAALSPFFHCDGSERRGYMFYSRAAKDFIELTASGIDIGAVYKRTPEAVAAVYDPQKRDAEDLGILWEAGRWDHLDRLARLDVETHGPHNTPALVFLGAAAYELERRADGYSTIGEYMRNYSKYWTTNYMAVGYYYMAREMLRDSKEEEAIGCLMDAYEHHPFERIMGLIQKLTGKEFALPPAWLQKPFPCDYDLPPLGGSGGRVSLGGTLQRMKPHQLLPVCLLSSYRGNGPYNDLMRRYINLSRYFGGFLAGLHVITSQTEREADRPHWYKAEDRAKALQVPLMLGFDESDAVSMAVRASQSPLNFLIDARGKVLHQGNLEAPDLWGALTICAS